MKKTLVMSSVAFVLLLAVVAAGLNVIFTVSYIDARFSTFSAQGAADAGALKKELDGYIGDSMTFLDLDDVEETVKKYPAFRVESVQKKFPKTVEVVVKERRELFAYETAEGFAMIDAEGNCVRMSDENVSRTGGENILLKENGGLKGFDLSVTVGSRAEGDYFDALLNAFSGIGEYVADARANVESVGLTVVTGSGSNPIKGFFEIKMREGVIVEMINPLSNAYEMAKSAMEKYGELNDIQKMYGRITVAASASGEINVNYSELIQ